MLGELTNAGLCVVLIVVVVQLAADKQFRRVLWPWRLGVIRLTGVTWPSRGNR